MTTDIPNLPSQYDPHNTENKWQQTWFERSVFRADPQKKGDPFCIVIPPPNVTGKLHMGHAFNTSLIDTVVRYHRMKGENVLCLPGTDHASIAVQTLVEKQIKAEGKTRYDLGREKFLEKAWEWKAESGGAIVNQLKRLGLSADWTRERFTLDENLCEAVKKAFITLYEEGLIYRGNYLVNWCPESQSAVSDLEVENKEVDGHLWHFRYPLSDGSGYVEVATTRPETMLGDTGVAVNPNDERYKDLIGKTLTLPIVGREIPVFADEHVDPEFGTGCVKVTPAHDPNDFEMGKRHNLEFINIMNRDGTLNENAGMFAGQDRFEARKNLVAKLKGDGVLVRTEDYRHSVPHSDRGKVPVEPLLSTQWFVKIDPLAQKTLAFLDEENQPNYVPERWRKVYRDWLVKLNDWCISRQLWWGHQIPAWYVVSETNGEIQDHTPFIVAHDEIEAKQKAIAKYGEDCQLEQDPDVLDTWFSSGLWPFSTLGWPDNSEDFQKYFPNSVLVTGFDIIFFWVARMTMMSSHFTGKIPFKDVYIHGLVRDENGKKMSKSANNGIDPLLMCDRYGTDALRYTLIREVAGAGQDISLQYDRKTDESQSVEASRNFANKLWNAARFVMMNLDGKTPTDLGRPEMQDLELGDRWILSRLHQVIADTHKNLEGYGLGEAAKALYEFIWGDFCDWYIELVKPRLYAKEAQDQASRTVAQQILAWVLEDILKLLHPFMPHITEEIWQTLTQADGQTFLATQLFPAENDQLVDPSLEDEFALLIEAIRTIRNLRAEAGIKPGATVTVILQSETETELNTLAKGEAYILKLAKVETLNLTNTVDNTLKQAIAGVVGTIQVLIPLEGLVDIPALRSKLEKNLVKVNKEIQSLSGRLNNPGFVNKAPAEVIEGARSALTEAEAQQSILTERLQRLQ
ncbi:valine--tRNA ligase [Picosynechococcus sp. PCC 11901]|uniref:valine--tRNA ligase n=1 Tax=Picosynechococcus sp. PCC 11901 TaxID=2579791 RepID=UPI0010FC1A61|nr:valine--tRNA ligase [Picosynechococcus sp. PCC 11901]QCS49782.1 valine--tRNA ligase [Picosynechococcus sp. PCC 11901]